MILLRVKYSSYFDNQYLDSFFDDAKNGLLKDLVDFQNRDDFDSYMKSLEKNYYNKLNLVQPPYEVLPDYPPKPYQSQKKKKNQQETKDFIDKVNEINQKRQQAFSYQAFQKQQPTPQQQFYQPPQNNSLSHLVNPYFDQIVNKENSMVQNPYPGPQFTPQAQYQAHPPTLTNHNMSYHGGLPQNNQVNNVLGQYMEPLALQQQQPPYLQRFVAGPLRLESNPLSEPLRNFKTQSPQRLQTNTPQDFDLKNPDVQYERYKSLMQNQYYNTNVNSGRTGFNITGAHTVYHPPPPFNNTNPQQQMQQNDPNIATFNPNAIQNQNMQASQNQLPPHIIGNMYPQTQQIYHQPVSLYQQQPGQMHQQMQGQGIPPGLPPLPGYPDFYRGLTLNNQVSNNIIDSIGGIENTLKPLEDTLRQHELRPFQIQRDYKKEYQYSQRGKSLKRSLSEHGEIKPETLHLVSVSPFRAVVKIDKSKEVQNQGYLNRNHEDEQSSSDEEEAQVQQNSFNNNFQRQEQRSQLIRADSQTLRGQREDFLGSFVDKRSHNNSIYETGVAERSFQNQNNANNYNNQQLGLQQTRDSSQQRIKTHSEYLRGQREQFLNGFSLPPNGIK
ncbi:UNKNOWN [Stylonychia lemnae]|uniref:Uncharacterized protein n=1 Tax=Stylonychia lemnae TaxID=5949 RepID=A0A078AAL9_STYLE|nr:UNKNOWN [Stylonychia lemnae]|eukprot:CDW77843.1 UNKNOWN [Stylonychia lemnae]